MVLPLALGLLGFIEPCTIGASLLFLHYLEGRTARDQWFQTATFAAARALLMGVLGAIAALIGTAFVDFQKAGWAAMGTVYVGLGLAYLTGSIDRLKFAMGVGLGRLAGTRGAVALGIIFAFNIPACAEPRAVALLGIAAISEGAAIGRGFVMLALFGLALSAPIALAVRWARGRWLLDRISQYSSRAPKVIGALFVLLGAWSIRFALIAQVV